MEPTLQELPEKWFGVGGNSWCHACLRISLVRLNSWLTVQCLENSRLKSSSIKILKAMLYGLPASNTAIEGFCLLDLFLSVSLQMTHSFSVWKLEGSLLCPWCFETSQRRALAWACFGLPCLGIWQAFQCGNLYTSTLGNILILFR